MTTTPQPQEGPYRMETPDAKLDKFYGPGFSGYNLANDTEIKWLNLAFAQGRLSLEAELKEAREALEGLVPKCDVCGVMTDKYVEENRPYCSLKCWNEANGDEDSDESILETWDKVTIAIAALTQSKETKPSVEPTQTKEGK